MTSKYYYFLLLLFLVACQTTSTKIEDNTLSAEEIQIATDLIQNSFDDLWAGLDSNKILKYHTPDFYILENGEHWDNQKIRDFMKSTLENTNRPHRENRMEFINIEKYGPSISMAYHNYATFSRNDSIVGKAQWLESAIAIPTPEGWRLRMMHSTWVPERKR